MKYRITVIIESDELDGKAFASRAKEICFSMGEVQRIQVDQEIPLQTDVVNYNPEPIQGYDPKT